MSLDILHCTISMSTTGDNSSVTLLNTVSQFTFLGLLYSFLDEERSSSLFYAIRSLVMFPLRIFVMKEFNVGLASQSAEYDVLHSRP